MSIRLDVNKNNSIMEKEKIAFAADKVKPLIIDGKKFRSTYDFKLTEKDLEKAFLELGETEKVRRSSLQALKKKLSETKNLHHHTEDEILLRYLRYQKFNVEKAYDKLCQLYRLRRDYPEEFSLPSNLETLLSSNAVKFLPYRTEEGCLVSWMDFRHFDADLFSVINSVKVMNAFGDIYSMNPSVQVNKLIAMWDMRGFSPRLCLQYLNPTTLMKIRRFLLDCYPFRIKQVILLHCNKHIHTAYSGIQYILKKKIADRVVLLGSDVSELHQYINPKILPKEYGGEIEENECLMTDIVISNMAFMKYERSFKFLPAE